jgi:hypothetical protein
MLGHEMGEVLRDGVVLGEPFGRPAEPANEDGAQPFAFGRADRVGRVCASLAPAVIEFAQFAGVVGLILGEALREHLFEDRQADERAGDLDQLEQFGVFAGGGHQARPSGTRNVTATGKSRGCGSA